MTKRAAPREYGISGETAMLLKPDWDIEKCKDYVAQYGRYGDPEPIHVIEKRAYDELVALAKDLAGALECYFNTPVHEHNAEDGTTLYFIARQTLAKHRDLLARLQGE